MTQDELNNEKFEVLELNLNGKTEIVLFSDTRIPKDLLDSLNIWAYDIRHSDECDNVFATVEDKVVVNYAGTILCGERLQIGVYNNIDDWSFTGENKTVIEYCADYTPKFIATKEELEAQCINYVVRALGAVGPISFSQSHFPPYINGQGYVLSVRVDDDGYIVAKTESGDLHEADMDLHIFYEIAASVYCFFKTQQT